MPQGDGITLSGDSINTHKTSRFCHRYRNRVVILPAAVKAIVAQRGASVAIQHRYYRQRRKAAMPEKNLPFWEGKHSCRHSACRLACRAEARTHFNWHKKKEDDNMRKRNTTIAIRCTEEESRRIHELAEWYGLKLSITLDTLTARIMKLSSDSQS